MIKTEIKNISLFIAFVTACLYVYGITFYQGFLAYWGLNETMFLMSFERTLFYGFLASAYLGIHAFLPALGVSVAAAAAFALAGILGDRIKSLTSIKFLSNSKTTKTSETRRKLLKIADMILTSSYWIFVVYFIAISLLSIAGNLGKSFARNEHERLAKNELYQVTVAFKSSPQQKMRQIICSDSHCAFLRSEEVLVYSLESITSITSKVKIP